MNIDKYKNKYISILGDSISTFEGCSEPKDAAFYNIERKIISHIATLSDTWWGQVIEKLGAKLLVNNSISGSSVTWHPSYEIQSYGCSDERTCSLSREGVSPDIIFVYLGTNDWGAGVKIVDEKNPDDLTVFYNAYREMLCKLKMNYPEAIICCLTLATSFCSRRKDFEFPYYSGGWHIAEYCNLIKRCADENQCLIIDLFNCMEPYDTIDGFHPNSDGMKTITDAVLKSL